MGGATAAQAWHSLPRAVRREVIDRGRRGLPADQALAPLVVERGLNQAWFTNGEILISLALLAVVVAGRALDQDGASLLGLAALILLAGQLLYASRVNYLYDQAHRLVLVNFPFLLASGSFRSPESLEVHGARRSRWYLSATAAPTVCYAGTGLIFLFHSSWSITTDLIVIGVVLAIAGAGYWAVQWRRQANHVVRRARVGEQVLTLNPTGLVLHHLGRSVDWSDVATANLVKPGGGTTSLAICFTVRDPDLTAAFEVEGLDQHPGLILATSRHFMSTAVAR